MNYRHVMPAVFLSACNLAAGADCWQPEPAPSDVVFVASQAGAPFEGHFRKFTGNICLDPANPGSGSIEIIIDTAGVDTGIPEFDDALRGADFFDVAHWPTARFASTSIRSTGQDRYSVRGRFTLRDVTREIEVPFALAPVQDGATHITGETVIKRLDYNIGLGEWRDTRWVGDEVTLRFRVALKSEGAGASAPAP